MVEHPELIVNYPVATVDQAAVMKRVPQNIGQALQGAAAGVQVSMQDGSPDGKAAIRIRGIGTINGDASPLYVVDGVQVGNNADFVNPADIERIEILKDASATAIYGSAGANGVVMITTKHGSKGHTIKYNQPQTHKACGCFCLDYLEFQEPLDILAKLLLHKHLLDRAVGLPENVDSVLHSLPSIAVQVIDFDRRIVAIVADLLQSFALSEGGIDGDAACRCRHGEVARRPIEVLRRGRTSISLVLAWAIQQFVGGVELEDGDGVVLLAWTKYTVSPSLDVTLVWRIGIVLGLEADAGALLVLDALLAGNGTIEEVA